MSAPQGDKDMDTIISTRRRRVVLGSVATLALGACGRVPRTAAVIGLHQVRRGDDGIVVQRHL